MYLYVCMSVGICVYGGVYMSAEVRGQPWVSVHRHFLNLFETGSHTVLEFTV